MNNHENGDFNKFNGIETTLNNISFNEIAEPYVPSNNRVVSKLQILRVHICSSCYGFATHQALQYDQAVGCL